VLIENADFIDIKAPLMVLGWLGKFQIITIGLIGFLLFAPPLLIGEDLISG
jgi:hypothetical protein